MKILTFTIGFLLLAHTASAASMVQATSTYVSALATQFATTSSAVTAGNLIAVYVQRATGTTNPTVTDDKGNTYTFVAERKNPAGGSAATQGFIWYAKNVVAGVTAVKVVRNTGSDMGLHVMEISGLDTADPFVASTTGNGFGTAAVASSTLTLASSGFIFAGAGQETIVGTNTAGPGYTIGTEKSNQNSFDEYRVAVAGTYNVNATTRSGQWVILGMSFKDSSAVVSTTYIPRLLIKSALQLYGQMKIN